MRLLEHHILRVSHNLSLSGRINYEIVSEYLANPLALLSAHLFGIVALRCSLCCCLSRQEREGGLGVCVRLERERRASACQGIELAKGGRRHFDRAKTKRKLTMLHVVTLGNWVLSC